MAGLAAATSPEFGGEAAKARLPITL